MDPAIKSRGDENGCPQIGRERRKLCDVHANAAMAHAITALLVPSSPFQDVFRGLDEEPQALVEEVVGDREGHVCTDDMSLAPRRQENEAMPRA